MVNCNTKDCEKSARSFGLCKNHYYAMRRKNEDIDRYGKCGVLDCKFAQYQKGFCGKHSRRLSRGSNPSSATIFDDRPHIDYGDYIHIPLGVGAKQGYAIADRNMAHLDKYRWHSDVDGYAANQRIGKMQYLVFGDVPNGNIIDHINGDRKDNRLKNLRLVTKQQNLQNRAVSSANKSGYKGVYLNKNRKRWCAAITPNGKSMFLGTYDTPELAAKAYNEAAVKYFGEYARLNVIE